ncbi:MAG: triose-phosphate isomerase [Ferruginibacter sp.]|nr:triose-phosphate isomerase [Bacteroidota bacterium]MBX2919503.1 triose-phosphate isomerase [Ferruginibacter sp.]MCB0709800.1 triose-phosphate isomerase [Chitinophagaceae bacterium]MCC7379975.1 triose-phosphate isomerase [Chitinophagaceae bacterium]
MRKQIAAANWKMNLTLQQANALMDELLVTPHQLKDNQEAVFGVPFPYLINIKNKLAGKKNVFVAAQNCYDKNAGAFTGEVSAEMLKSIDVDYVILGHSERREYFNESHAMLAQKVNLCFTNGLKPIFCCGEPLAIREAATQNAFVENQLKESLFHLSAQQLTGFVIAYEPIWAIGTGKTASNEQAQQMHAHIRSVIAKQYGSAVAESISILYGGSVKANNAKEIFAQPDVDGGLVGGASLVAADFAAIINSLK